MKRYTLLDWVPTAIVALVTVSIIAWLAWPTKDPAPWRTSVTTFVATLPAVHTILWWLRGRSLRLCFYQWYHKHYGPECTVTIRGSFHTDSPDPKDLLDRFFSVVRHWDDTAHRSQKANYSTVLTRARSLTAQVIQPDEESIQPDTRDEEDVIEPDPKDEAPNARLAFTLTGYDGRITRVDSLLEREVLYLLPRLQGALTLRCAPAPLFSLDARITSGANPFLTFWLRDVPLDDVDAFTVEGKAEEYYLRVTADSVSVSSTDPIMLVQQARRHLASPTLPTLAKG